MAKPKNQNPSAAPAASATAAVNGNGASQKVFDAIERIPGWLRTTLCFLIVLAIGWCMYFVGHAEPKYAFWDENYHLTSAQRYIDGVAYLETHPPLGKLLIAVGEKLSGANPGIDKSALSRTTYIDGDKLPEGFSFAGMRLMPALFGALAALLFFGLMLELTGNRLVALLFSSLYLFENAFIVHFRAVHLDSFQMFFSLGALWLFMRMWKQEERIPLWQYAASAALCGLAIMVKINAALLLALFPVLYFKDAGTREAGWDVAAQLRHFALKSATAIASIAVVALCVFTVHALVGTEAPRPQDPLGEKDLPHMSSTYKDYLNLKQPLTPSTLLAITGDYFSFMRVDNQGVPKLDVCKPGENGSHPLNWPLHNKTINYRWDSADGFTRYVQLAGNQVSWYLGLAAVLLSILTIANRRLFGVESGAGRSYALIEVFTGLYLVFMLLHLYLGAQRVMYLYHYFLGLLISYILIVLNWQNLCELNQIKARTRLLIVAGMSVLIIASSLFFLPLNNHKPLNKEQCERRNVFSHIVDCQG
ncbi:phospholipid carrier-dependent glycosyltransferase [Uliginosibacterium aquaticum]|uniref:Polyprenol-phosphate-mannose--protein mannosyltransferase n=1 Tax=Uliginosibacterium aquaticum TaxID=2731212 RepID=A0ABX2ILC1_9RHOO|nr:phospholipid carrier-dependent glycosyltransferase [Uliginosibacterium aquaticum]NSL56683.1 phospholipid carrier-dependent glycosyltransferase [Uliginosibacterium aquaticum]